MIFIYMLYDLYLCIYVYLCVLTCIAIKDETPHHVFYGSLSTNQFWKSI